FLKVVYHGPQYMEELVRYDPHMIVGILGGSAGTTYDAFKLLSEAKKYGARVALFGRKINNAENQLAFIHFLRLIADGEISAEEAVRAYHGVLQKLGIRPHRSLDDDLQLQTNVMNYGGNGVARSLPPPSNGARKPAASPELKETHAACACQCRTPATKVEPAADGTPDFSRMTPAEKIARHKARWDGILGDRTTPASGGREPPARPAAHSLSELVEPEVEAAIVGLRGEQLVAPVRLAEGRIRHVRGWSHVRRTVRLWPAR